MSKISLSNIQKNFTDTVVLTEIDLVVAEGEVVSLLGPSGCGKTTLLKIIAGLLSPDRGEVRIGEEVVNSVPVDRRGAVIVFQDHRLFPHMTVAENIGFGLKMAGRSKATIQSQVERMLDLVELQGLGRRYPNELSGGQQQRVALARALAVEPRVLLLDEPFSNLDARLKDSVREFTLGLQRSLGITTILVTHEKEEAFMYSDHIAVMLGGRICQYGTPEEVYRSPASLAVAEFLGEHNLVEGLVRNGDFLSASLTLPGIRPPETGSVRCTALVRPQDLLIDPAGELPATILARKFAGQRIHYTVRTGGQKLWLTAAPGQKAREGEEVRLTVNTQNVLFYDQEDPAHA